MSFFEEFDEASWEFTYGHETNDQYNVLQVGLVAIFHLDKAWEHEKRVAIADAFELYINEFGKKLVCGYIGDVNSQKKFFIDDRLPRKERILSLEDGALEACWRSNEDMDYVSDYQVEVYSPAGWYEHVHHRVSYFRIYLPVTELKGEGKDKFEKLIADFCRILKPMHRLAGLGIQQIYEHEKFQHHEYEISKMFNGIDMTNPYTDKEYRKGIKSINWHTIICNELADKVGGDNFSDLLKEKQFKIIDYKHGLIIRAGETPELGWNKKAPYPPLYVKINNILKPIRAPKLDSFGFGSNAGEIRFDDKSTANWLKRFDIELPGIQPAPVQELNTDPKRINAFSGEISPHTGRWGTFIDGSLRYVHLKQGQKLPDYEDKEGKLRRTIWSLLERDDKDNIFVNRQ
ncbi:type VI immunity family protein [Rahnella contaminans]|uniref:type VI immunity family protein n=1 Tax=Rahnella contaminans TaxID=2703882 RepID=UPI0023DAEE54|nr:type VI immunity family protein [Rahnella contaminans]MDF1895380.1 DUF3396 domain-containing protein [Rahnella contaminans]